LPYFVNDHIQRSWPEQLLQALLRKEEKYGEKLVKDHLGEHRHEHTIARVLREAARNGNTEIIKLLLLRDNVHPDVRVSMRDDAAIDVADEPEVRLLLYERGAKLLCPPEGYPLYWPPGENVTNENGSPPRTFSVPEKSCRGELRGLIVDIYSRTNEPKAKGVTEEHWIVHPTVHEMINTKSPGRIMRELTSTPSKDLKPLRWIHLPMNHVSSPSIYSIRML
jgi:hypothetical protein